MTKEAKPALASSIDAAIERGEVTSTREGWRLSKLDNSIPNAEVDRWRPADRQKRKMLDR